MNTKELVERVRIFEIDHKPNGFPAAEMSFLSALADEIDRLVAENAALKNELEAQKSPAKLGVKTVCARKKTGR